MRKIYALSGVAVLLFILSGCLYPNSELARNAQPNEAQLEMVESAVLQYKEKTNGLVPIKTKDSDVDYYQKYLVDFNVLEEQQLLSERPGTAYESGGIYQYTLIEPEEDTKVKLIDLRLSELVRKARTKMNIYRSEHRYPPFGEQIADGVYKLNYKKLGFDQEPVVASPYTKNNLPLILNNEGEIFIDYRIDLQQALDEFEPTFEHGDDIRTLLTDHYPFVPAYSMPYTIEDGDVVFLSNEE